LPSFVSALPLNTGHGFFACSANGNGRSSAKTLYLNKMLKWLFIPVPNIVLTTRFTAIVFHLTTFLLTAGATCSLIHKLGKLRFEMTTCYLTTSFIMANAKGDETEDK
jgi:nicotinamide riboside transporter PnuC